jgi:hypothetical protein
MRGAWDLSFPDWLFPCRHLQKKIFWHSFGTEMAQFLGKVCRGEEKESSTGLRLTSAFV